MGGDHNQCRQCLLHISCISRRYQNPHFHNYMSCWTAPFQAFSDLSQCSRLEMQVSFKWRDDKFPAKIIVRFLHPAQVDVSQLGFITLDEPKGLTSVGILLRLPFHLEHTVQEVVFRRFWLRGYWLWPFLFSLSASSISHQCWMSREL